MSAADDLLAGTPALGQQVNPSGQPMVYLTTLPSGSHTVQLDASWGDARDIKLPGQRLEKPLDLAMLDILGWTDEQRVAFADKLIAANMLPAEYTRDDLEAAWGKLVEKAAKYQTAGQKNVTPFDVIGMYQGINILTGDPMKKTGSSRQTQSVVNLTDPWTSRAAINQAFVASLGREATDKEIDDFTAALNDTELHNPSVSTGVTGPDGQYSDETASRTDGTTYGGVSTGAFADKYVKDRYEAEADAFRSAGAYMDAVFAGIRSPV